TASALSRRTVRYGGRPAGARRAQRDRTCRRVHRPRARPPHPPPAAGWGVARNNTATPSAKLTPKQFPIRVGDAGVDSDRSIAPLCCHLAGSPFNFFQAAARPPPPPDTYSRTRAARLRRCARSPRRSSQSRDVHRISNQPVLAIAAHALPAV